MKPTVISMAARTASVPAPASAPDVPAPAAAGAMSAALVLPANFPLALTPEQLHQTLQRIDEFDLGRLSLAEVSALGAETEVALHRALGQFLDRIDRGEQPRLFRLIDELREAVAKEDLPALAERILDGKPTLGERVSGWLSTKALGRAAATVQEEIRLLLAGKTRKLGTLLSRMEQELDQERARTEAEVRTLDALKQHYREQFTAFALSCAWLHGALHQSQARAAALIDQPDIDRRELQDKLAALESRALAMEGVLTRLPADQLTITQIQTAAIHSLREITTTAAARFASIKMTLLTLHSALAVQDLQRLDQRNADLDANLMQVRARLTQQVVATAAEAPGRNRLREAEQIQAIVRETEALVSLVDQAKGQNAQQFEQARQMLSAARGDLARLGAVIRPDRPLP